MSLPEVATYLGMAERTIYVWAQQGKIPAFKLGTSWRFRRSEIDAWLETQRSGPDFSTGRRPLVDPVEPAMTRSMREKTERDAVEKQITDCVDEIELALRVALVDPDDDLLEQETREFTLGANWFFHGHRNKLTVDVSRLEVDFPAASEETATRVRMQWDVSF